ncbi:MAG: hypothetical protein GKR90_10900 [Pseudomonadales bacterium]|nr:hypothetical protein [Pseudomonadales bacterium]
MANYAALKLERERFGVFRLIYRIAMDRLSGFVQLYQIHSRNLASGAVPEPTPARVGWATHQELMQASGEIPSDLSPEFVRTSLARGDRCLAAFIDNKLVSFGWRAYTDTPHVDGVWISFRPGYRYGYKSFTRPEYRGRHILDPKYSDKSDVDRGIRYSVGFVASHNFPSKFREKRIGSNIIHGHAGYFTLCGKFIFFHSPGVKRIGFEFYLPSS